MSTFLELLYLDKDNKVSLSHEFFISKKQLDFIFILLAIFITGG